LERLAPLSGIAFVVLVAVGFGVMGGPDFLADSDEIAEFYVDEMGPIVIGAILMSLGALALLWFGGSLRVVLRVAEGGEGRLSALAFSGAVGGATLLLASAASQAAGALRGDEDGKIDPGAATVLFDWGILLFGFAAPYAFAALLVATTLVSLRTGVLPAWLAWVGALIALGLLIPPISYAVNALFGLWVIITSVILFRRPAAPA
jgi:hypothetical protein